MYDLYDMIFKRKSFRRFDETLSLTSEDMKKIEEQLCKLITLVEDIEVKYQIVKRKKTTCKRGEYCLLVYSEKKENYLLNIGYILEQLDLWMASENIGACWYGMGKTAEQKYDGLDFVIMLAIGKSNPSEFRKNYLKAKRKELVSIWKGENFSDVANVVRYAPSACNSQPWRIFCEKDNIKIYRSTKIRSIMPESKQPYYNSIDMGIFLCFMEITLKKKGYPFKRILCTGQKNDEELISVAEYKIINSNAGERRYGVIMESLNDYIREYSVQLKKGQVQKAYKGIMLFMGELKAYMENKYSEYIAGALYLGYMDMTYFAFTPLELKNRKLKIAVVYLHEQNRFEVWLAGSNKNIQAEYIKLLKHKDIDNYKLSQVLPGVDSIIESIIDEQPDFDHIEELRMKIESKTIEFANHMLSILNE